MRTLESILDVDKAGDKVTETVVLSELAKVIRGGSSKSMQFKIDNGKRIALIEDWVGIVKPFPKVLLKNLDILVLEDGGCINIPEMIGGKTFPNEIWAPGDVDFAAHKIQNINIVAAEDRQLDFYNFTSTPSINIMSDCRDLRLNLNSCSEENLSSIKCTGNIGCLAVEYEDCNYYDEILDKIVIDPFKQFNIKLNVNQIYFNHRDLAIVGFHSNTPPRDCIKRLGKVGNFYYFKVPTQ